MIYCERVFWCEARRALRLGGMGGGNGLSVLIGGGMFSKC